jgi:hypothetical protein
MAEREKTSRRSYHLSRSWRFPRRSAVIPTKPCSKVKPTTNRLRLGVRSVTGTSPEV